MVWGFSARFSPLSPKVRDSRASCVRDGDRYFFSLGSILARPPPADSRVEKRGTAPRVAANRDSFLVAPAEVDERGIERRVQAEGRRPRRGGLDVGAGQGAGGFERIRDPSCLLPTRPRAARGGCSEPLSSRTRTPVNVSRRSYRSAAFRLALRAAACRCSNPSLMRICGCAGSATKFLDAVSPPPATPFSHARAPMRSRASAFISLRYRGRSLDDHGTAAFAPARRAAAGGGAAWLKPRERRARDVADRSHGLHRHGKSTTADMFRAEGAPSTTGSSRR